MMGDIEKGQSSPALDRHTIISFIIGILFVLAGFWLYRLEAHDGGAVPAWAGGFACLGVGVIVYGICRKLSGLSKGYDYAAAISLAITIFCLFNFIQPKYAHAKLEVRAEEEAAVPALKQNESQARATGAAILFRGEFLEGRLQKNPYASVFDFDIPTDKQKMLEATDCPELIVLFSDRRISRRFVNSSFISPEYVEIFDIVFKMDKKRVFSLRGRTETALEDCSSQIAKDVLQEKHAMTSEREVSPGPSGALKTVANDPPGAGEPDKVAKLDPPPPHPGNPGDAISAPSPPPAPSEPASAPVPSAGTEPQSGDSSAEIDKFDIGKDQPKDEGLVTDASADNNSDILGYVVISQLAADSGKVEESFFDFDDAHGRIPQANQLITLSAEKAVLRKAPFHWDLQQRAHVVADQAAEMTRGQQAIVAGDCFIVRDEGRGGVFYIIAPVLEIVGKDLARDQKIYLPKSNIDGFVYIGYLDGQNPELNDKSFDNFSSPSSIYPAPNDVLIARNDIWLRAGPRHFDRATQQYLKPRKVLLIRKGDSVRMRGDILLTGKGISAWVPVTMATAPLGKAQSSFSEKVSNFFQKALQ